MLDKICSDFFLLVIRFRRSRICSALPETVQLQTQQSRFWLVQQVSGDTGAPFFPAVLHRKEMTGMMEVVAGNRTVQYAFRIT